MNMEVRQGSAGQAGGNVTPAHILAHLYHVVLVSSLMPAHPGRIAAGHVLLYWKIG